MGRSLGKWYTREDALSSERIQIDDTTLRLQTHRRSTASTIHSSKDLNYLRKWIFLNDTGFYEEILPSDIVSSLKHMANLFICKENSYHKSFS
ncbi:hypothetical protein SAMN05444392_108123 [Seinonella peptonophila]|uniref:Uncharacterized protein n=1 Tax=Seinonella peptonophila TaxID=112248 RepID=A0A1M4ZAB8_9BACL|nr:hypothetical protein SAMN05444392_108123 [Seinonella peptonophila]